MNKRDATAGGLFIVLGALFALGALQLPLGTAIRMGPGYFPLVLSGLLVLMGLITLLQARSSPHGASAKPVPWRGLVLILAAPIVFGLCVRGLGLAPSIVVVILLASYASRRMTHRMAFMLAVGLTLFCILVFSWALGLPIERFGPWTRLLMGGGGVELPAGGTP